MMQITIYSGFSKEINNTKQPTGGTIVNCTLKADTSLLKPVFIMDSANLNTNYVAWNNRYYWVDDVVSIRNNAVELHCIVDVLASWKSNIGSSTQYVVRAAADWDPILIDSLYPMGGTGQTTTIDLSSIHTQMSNDGCYIVGVLGGNSLTGVTYYQLFPSTFASLINALFAGNYLQAPVTEISLELQKELVNPIQYITSIQWFPFTPDIQTSQSIKFGFWDSGISGSPISESDSLSVANFTETINIPDHPDIHTVTVTRRGYLNNTPYTRMLLHVYSFGDVVIDASLVRSSMTVNIDVDLFTGVGYLYCVNNAGNIIARSTAQIGVPIPLGQTTQNLIQSAVGVVSTIGAIAQGNFIGVLSGIGDAVSGLLPQLEKTGAYGSRIAFKETPSLLIEHHLIAEADREHNGSPLMQRRTISTLPGYIQVENPDIDIPGTREEKQQIVGFMQSGFYYE